MEVTKLFDYDSHAPPDMVLESSQSVDDLHIYDLAYESLKGGRMSASLVVPEGIGPFAGILATANCRGYQAFMTSASRKPTTGGDHLGLASLTMYRLILSRMWSLLRRRPVPASRHG